MTSAEYGALIEWVCLTTKVTRVQLAAMLGAHPITLSRRVAGEYPIKLDAATRLLDLARERGWHGMPA